MNKMRSFPEPRWVTKILRLFPRPIFAAAISAACFLVTMLFTGMAIFEGQWFFGVGALVFGAGAYAIVAAMIVRRRQLRFVRQQQELHAPLYRSSTILDLRHPNGETEQPSNRGAAFNDNDDLRGLPPVRTLHLLLYLSTVLVWETQIASLLLRALGGVQLAAVWRYSLLGLYVIVTLLAVWFGRRDIQRLRNSGGNVELSRIQAVIVAVVMVSFCVTGIVVYKLVTDIL